MNKLEIFKRLYKDYTKKHLKKIILSAIFSILVAGSTSGIAWLLDPAIKKIFIEKDQSLIFIIPLLIVVAFATKGISLYVAKSLMIQVGEEISKFLQFDMVKSLIKADTQSIDKKHSGKFISNLTYDVTHITNLLSNAILTLFKDSLTLFGLLLVMFIQNWKLALISIIMIPLASVSAKILGKRISKVTTEAQQKSGLSIGYPGWGLLYYIVLCSLASDGNNNILETGTNYGASTIIIAQALKDSNFDGHIHTIEIDKDNAQRASNHLSLSGVGDLVTQHIGDAKEVLRQLVPTIGQLQVVFLDGSHLYNDVVTEVFMWIFFV